MKQTSRTAEKVLDVLEVLLANFSYGVTPGDIAKATGLDASGVTRYIATLEQKGFAERITETGRIRPSVRLAQRAMAILKSIDANRARLDELTHRISTTL